MNWITTFRFSVSKCFPLTIKSNILDFLLSPKNQMNCSSFTPLWKRPIQLSYWLQIYNGDNRPCITPHVMASLAMGPKSEVFRFLLTHIGKNKCKTMRPRFTHVYLHAQTAVDAGDRRAWQTTIILIAGKTQRPPIWALGIKMAQVLESSLYICATDPWPARRLNRFDARTELPYSKQSATSKIYNQFSHILTPG